MKKTWGAIRNLIKVSRKKTTAPTKIIYKDKEQFSDGDIAESLNDFFVNIGTSIERKIPKTSTPFSSYLNEPNNYV